MKNALLVIIGITLLISCSVFQNEENKEFTAKINNDALSGTAVFVEAENVLYLRGFNNGDTANGRTVNIKVDNFNGVGTYNISAYRYSQITGGDASFTIATSYEPNGIIEIKKINSSSLTAEFSGTFISRDSTEIYEGKIFFNVNK